MADPLPEQVQLKVSSITKFLKDTETKAIITQGDTVRNALDNLSDVIIENNRLRKRVSELEEENRRLKAQQAKQPAVVQPVTVPVSVPVVPKIEATKEEKDDTEVRFSLLELT